MLETVTEPNISGSGLTALVLDHLKLEPEEEEAAYADLLDTYIAAAVEKVESASGRRLFTRSMRFTADGFATPLVIPASPVIEVTSVEYLDAAGGLVTLDDDAYALTERLETPKLVPVMGTTWPATAAFPGAVLVDFDAGYGESVETIPAQLRVAVLQTVADWYRFGGNVATSSLMELPASARRACMSFRREWA